MNIEQIKNKLPECAKDIKLNFGNILTEEGAPDLNVTQRYGIALSCAYTTKNKLLISAISEEAGQYLSSGEIEAAKSAAIIMAMNNTYYRFIYLVNDKNYLNMPVGLRMNVMRNPEINKVDFELNCLAASVLNGCGICIESHTRNLEKTGVNKKTIQSVARIAAVVYAMAVGVALEN